MQDSGVSNDAMTEVSLAGGPDLVPGMERLTLGGSLPPIRLGQAFAAESNKAEEKGFAVFVQQYEHLNSTQGNGNLLPAETGNLPPSKTFQTLALDPCEAEEQHCVALLHQHKHL